MADLPLTPATGRSTFDAVVSADEAARIVEMGDTPVIGGSGGGHAVSETLIAADELRFVEESAPQNLTSLHPVGGLGDRGVSRFAHDGMRKRIICATLADSPRVEAMTLADWLEAYVATSTRGIAAFQQRRTATFPGK